MCHRAPRTASAEACMHTGAARAGRLSRGAEPRPAAAARAPSATGDARPAGAPARASPAAAPGGAHEDPDADTQHGAQHAHAQQAVPEHQVVAL